jgi:ribonuclease P protein component
MRPQGFPRRLRLRRRMDFLRAQRLGHKHHMRHFLAFVLERADQPHAGQITAVEGTVALPPTRLGVTVTRKVGGAVLRNRIKRLVREAFRRERHLFDPGYDLVFIAKRSAADTTYGSVVSDLQALARKLKRRGERAAREAL